MSLDYLDFELELNVGDRARGWPLSVVRSPAGNDRATMMLPDEPAALAQAAASGDPRVYGRKLFELLIVGEIFNNFYKAIGMANGQGKKLRVILRIVDAQLAVIPWELLYHEYFDEFVALSQKSPIVRYAEAPQPLQPLTVESPLRILGMAVDPTGTLSLEKEKRGVEDSLRELIDRGLVKLDWLEGQTTYDLQRAMRSTKGPWHVFHFIGHGGFGGTNGASGAGTRDFGVEPDPAAQVGGEGYLLLANAQGGRAPLNATALGRILAGHDSLRLVVLNACHGATASPSDLYAGTAGTLTRLGVPAVIAMQFALLDVAGVTLARVFYDALADGLPLEAALTEARITVASEHAGRLDWAAPVLYLRSPDGVLFATRPQPTVVSPPPPRPPVGPPRARLTELTGPQHKLFDEALLSAFSHDSLRQMVRHELNENLDHFAGGSDLMTVVYKLTDWAQRRGYLDALLDGALRAEPGNAKLQALARTLRG